MNAKTGKSLILIALLSGTGLTPAYANMLRTSGDTSESNMSIPQMLPSSQEAVEGDDLGNHIATEPLVMSSFPITGLARPDGADPSAAVNVGYLADMLGTVETPATDNLGNHIAERTLDLRGHAVVNVADAYGGSPGSAVNIATLTRYLNNLPGPDNLGNHVAVTDLRMNGRTIFMGAYDASSATPPAGVAITATTVTGLSTPTAGSDAANKTYVDGTLANSLADVVYRSGAQTITGSKTFSAQIQARSGINLANTKIVNLGTPTAAADAANKAYVDNAIAAANTGAGNYTASDGVALTGTNFAADATVVRTFGIQRISGAKTFNELLTAIGGISVATQKITNLGDATDPTDGVNLRTLESRLAALPTSGDYLAGSGVNISTPNAAGARTVSVDTTVVRTFGPQTIMGLKNFTHGPVYMNGLGNDTVVLKLRSSNSVMDATSQESDVFPAAIRTLRNHGFSIEAGTHPTAGKHAVHFDLVDSAPTTNPNGAAYNSGLLNISFPYRSGYDGSTVGVANAQEPADGGTGSGLVATFAYRNILLKRHVDVDGGLWVKSSVSGRRALFDVPLLGNQGLTVNPGAGEVRFNSTVFGHRFTTFSDERLKENVQTISAEDAAEILESIRPVSYDLKDTGKHAYGVIAQEVQKVMPWAVEESKDGILSVDYVQIIPPLTAAVVEMRAENAALEDQIEALEARLDALESGASGN